MSKKDLRVDTQDVIEKKWAKIVCAQFPAYAFFWNEFIGVRTKPPARKLLWYKYKFPNSWKKSKKQQYEYDLEELFMVHYTLFCNFAGAHFQLNELVASLRETNIDEMHFRYWEAFECCYQHMGNARNYFYLFWDKIFSITGNTIKRKPNRDLDIRNVANETRKIFKSYRKLMLYQKIDKELGRNGQIIIIRNNTVHYARLSSWFIGANKGYALPYKLTPNIRWTKKNPPHSGILAQKKAEKHLDMLEKLVNEGEQVAISYLRKYLQNENISIQY